MISWSLPITIASDALGEPSSATIRTSRMFRTAPGSGSGFGSARSSPAPTSVPSAAASAHGVTNVSPNWPSSVSVMTGSSLQAPSNRRHHTGRVRFLPWQNRFPSSRAPASCAETTSYCGVTGSQKFGGHRHALPPPGPQKRCKRTKGAIKLTTQLFFFVAVVVVVVVVVVVIARVVAARAGAVHRGVVRAGIPGFAWRSAKNKPQKKFALRAKNKTKKTKRTKTPLKNTKKTPKKKNSRLRAKKKPAETSKNTQNKKFRAYARK